MTVGNNGVREIGRGSALLFVLGLLGVVALGVFSVPGLREVPELASLSFPVLVAIAAANSAVLLVVFVVLGALTAPRIGLRSHLYAWATGADPEWQEFRVSLPLAVGLGAVLFVVITLLDVAFAPFLPAGLGEAASDAEALRALAESVPMRLLYGGITEELLLRWGVMSPLAWGLWRARTRLGSATDRPSSGTMWAAITVTAVLFGLGHLPALAASFELTTMLVLRTVLLNAIVGLGLGWLYWRHSLETAMAAHAAFHVALVAVSSLLLVAN
ncbi:CPBP family intramembrane glutamic endopeptidase [Halosimplex sp. J119]